MEQNLDPRQRLARQRLGLVLLPDEEAPSRARRLLRDALGARLEGRVDRAELILSELITNAVSHGQDEGLNPVRLVLEVVGGVLRIEVTDAGPGFVPRRDLPRAGTEGGWGLVVVAALSDRWGIDRGDRVTRVWAEMDPVALAA